MVHGDEKFPTLDLSAMAFFVLYAVLHYGAVCDTNNIF